MKRNRIWIVLGGLAAAGVGVYFGTQALFAQPGAAPARPRSRIAVMNIAKVVKEFNHARQLDEEAKQLYKTYQDKLDAKRTQAQQLQAQMAKETVQAQKDVIEKQALHLSHEVQEIQAEAQKFMKAKQQESFVQIYREVEQAVQQVAVANDLDLILSYPDAPTEAEKNNPMVAMSKLSAPALMPIYYPQTLDVTPVVIATLNRNHPAPAPAPGAAPAPN